KFVSKKLKDPNFHLFHQEISAIDLPEKFTFPFYYEPHPLCEIAVEELQEFLKTQTEWKHNFGLNPNQDGLVIGKMFGVLVVKNQAGELGYLAAFSGKMAGGNHHRGFVPPVFDMLRQNSFFLEEEKEISAVNEALESKEKNPEYLKCEEEFELESVLVENELKKERQKVKDGKKSRKVRREKAKTELNESDFLTFNETLRQESLKQNYFFKDISKHWKDRLEKKQNELNAFVHELEELRLSRKTKSAALQQKLFAQYKFLNIEKKSKDLNDIFKETIYQKPIAGAGECAAPKLLQYAFLHDLKPVCMAEFWWGESPKSEIRKSGYFYPACRGKCEPILGHMLEGMEVDENPMLKNPAEGKELEILFNDADIIIVNKPSEFLSVPGKTIKDSVYLRIKKKYPEATGPLIVHRLDMSTSGILLIAKNKETHKHLQLQFIKRYIKKKYVALLNGNVEKDTGFIDLPLAPDFNNRPQQMVCYEKGKSSRTRFEVIERKDGKTRIHFYPVTGRTHQ
ncbi:MAG: pseudouridine synthase, partial [Saprospiraceae bacterium]